MASDYAQQVEQAARDGARRYRSAVRMLVDRARPELARSLAEDAFAEPLVIACLSADAADALLDQLVIGMPGPRAGPASARAVADADGRVRVPRLGSWSVGRPGSTVELRRDGRGAVRPHRDGTPLEAPFTPALLAGPRRAELLPGGHPLLARLYVDDAGAPATVRLAGLAKAHATHLDRALSLLAELAPRYGGLVLDAVRTVVLHAGERPNSFATPAAHGAVFLNMALGDDEVFLVEDLAHQGGHVVFAAAALDRERWFRADPETALRELTGEARDRRSLYVALHGVFTEAAMVDALDRWRERDELEGRQAHELDGRLAFVLRRLLIDLRNLAVGDALSREGNSLLRSFAEVGRDVATRRPQLLSLRLGAQGHSFDYARFAAENPRARARSRGPAGRRGPRRDRPAPELGELSRVGFGGYRIAAGVPEHERALRRALELGCNLVDTAATYTGGRSEELIGRLLRDPSAPRPFVVTKGGYAAGGGYSLEPDFLRARLERSRERLGLRRLDAFLLHDPEHWLDARPEASAAELDAAIERAFALLEDRVAAGELGAYGVSSNALADHGGDPRAPAVPRLVAAARRVAPEPALRLLQLPVNLVERGAVEPRPGGSPVALAQAAGLRVLANRPLNAVGSAGALLLAEPDAGAPEPDADAGARAVAAAIEALGERLRASEPATDPAQAPLLAFLARGGWSELPSPEAADALVARHLAPLLARAYAQPPPPAERELYARLHETLVAFARRNRGRAAVAVRAALAAEGRLGAGDARPLALVACAHVLDSGVDHVLVGMRRVAYVDALHPLFADGHDTPEPATARAREA